ncbi:HD domain-containing protein [Faecalibacterium duncaniae]|jgi:3'-5' exoribonuclease|uniref:HD domain-containing protein n=1 Tax=Faecalibacterium duncaniae (strain DSM 17677 / JCM 31915 / A2-165) TaxID=411483 RepID=UPI00209E2ADF|nr:HD domain-containing protein [Faecalibacterium duncaniae]UTB40735.1 HDIG domain-containing protein [Faecalibacterium duncaniae]UVY59569.1 MAG: Putative helicase [Bacteriophage sp.]UWG01510.1 MAG: Putative helicase [Bacteriophage sp.]UWG20698.1 MAG: Putative helicase [Bacteriophage sp.]
MDKKLLKEEYKRLLTKAIEGRPGGMALMIVLEETDFYNSPASAKHHLNVPGGLVLHSLNVARTALELCENMPQFARCDKNAVLTAALLHDVCKAGNYIQKPDGSYQYRDTDLLGHGEASVINIQHWIHLTDKEVLAIRWHMGAYTGERDWDTLSKVYDRYPEVLCLHMADMIATHIMEVEE